jgi:large subunit ribosomal protein L23
MKSYQDVIVRPIALTEKGEILREATNQYLFEVASKSTKPEIREAVEKLFKVGVSDVNTMIVRGKPRRVGRRMSKRPNWKKAIVTLVEGDKIEFFEGV